MRESTLLGIPFILETRVSASNVRYVRNACSGLLSPSLHECKTNNITFMDVGACVCNLTCEKYVMSGVAFTIGIQPRLLL